MKFKKVHTLKLALKLEDSQWSSNRLDVRGEGIFFNNRLNFNGQDFADDITMVL